MNAVARFTLRFVAQSRGLAKFTAGVFYLIAFLDWIIAGIYAALAEWDTAWDGMTNGFSMFVTAALLSALIHVTRLEESA